MGLKGLCIGLFGSLLLIFGCGKKADLEIASMNHLQNQLAKLAPVTLGVDINALGSEAETVRLLAKASQIMNDIFIRQVDEQSPDMLEHLKASKNPDDKIAAEYMDVMCGPWDRLDEDRPFVGKKIKPLGAAFYPEDMALDEWTKWIEAHPDDREAFESSFTVIRRKSGNLVAIPYSEYYPELNEAASLLRQAAAKTAIPSLKKFLESRATAFLSNNYYQSDIDWMDLEGPIEIVIGPYEVYEDRLLSYKASFEAYLCVVNHEESERLKTIVHYLNAMESRFPIPDVYKNFSRGSSSPIKVVDQIFNAGEAKPGVQTAAFNLPNDERVRAAKGSKKVMLKNVMNAKFNSCWIPICDRVLSDKDRPRVSFDAYFAHVLMHEVSHGLGPGQIIKKGRETTVSKELKDLYPTIEECKADVLGIFTAEFLCSKKVFPKSILQSLYATNLGGLFRSIRFGIGEAHGGGVAIQLNYLIERGAVKAEEDGRFSVNDKKMSSALKELARELLLIEAEGDYARAQRLIERYKNIKPETARILERLAGVPVDIRPRFEL